MEAPIPSIPSGWQAVGTLPPFDVKHVDDEALMDWFTEDILQVTEPGGVYCIDVGWYPTAERDGVFRCVVVKDRNWDRPVKEFEAKTVVAVRAWLDEAFAFVRQRTLQ